MKLQLNKWGNHDVKYLNAVMKTSSMAEIRIAVYDHSRKKLQDEFLWADMRRLGLHDVKGNYFQVELLSGKIPFELEFAGEGDVFVLKVSSPARSDLIRFYVSGLLRWGTRGTVTVSDDEIILDAAGEKDVFTFAGKQDRETPVNAQHPGILFCGGEAVYVRCNNDWDKEKMEGYLSEIRAKTEKAQARGEGELDGCAEALVKGVVWNTFYDPVLRSPCTSISRRWSSGHFEPVFGSFILAEWDTFFAGLLSGVQDKELAYLQVYNILSQATEKGFIPNISSQIGKSSDRSQPPVGAYCIYKIFCQFGDRDLLENTFDRLMAWHDWWFEYRDGNGDGLLEWGSDPSGESIRIGYEQHSLLAAKYESGLDNSTMYDEASFNEKTNTMELIDVGLNALIALDASMLARIARELGRDEEAAALEKEYDHLKSRINTELWCEEKGIYFNRFWDGGFSLRMSPTCFYPMLAGIASEEQARRLLTEHILNSDEFWGEYVIPSTSKAEKEYYDNDYWRGRIWGPFNYLVYEGLKRYGFYDAAGDFARKSLRLFQGEWKSKNRIYENYNSISGEGGDSPASDPLYHWGGLLAYIAISEVVEALPWGGIRFGSPVEGSFRKVVNYPIGGDRYTVSVEGGTGGMGIWRNGFPFIECSGCIMLTNFSIKENTVSFGAVSKNPVRVRVFPQDGIDRVRFTGAEDNVMEYELTEPFIEIGL